MKAPSQTSGFLDRASNVSMRFMVLDFADIEARKEAYNSSSDFDRGVVRLAITWSKILGIKRNDIISVKHGTQRAFYAVKFHYTLSKGEIALDYDQRSFLDVKKGRRASLILQKTWPLVGMFRFLWSHPDLKTRSEFKMAVWLTIVSMLLGVLLSGIFG